VIVRLDTGPLVAILSKDMWTSLTRSWQPSIIELYRDRDSAGDALLASFQTSLPDMKVIDRSDLYDGYKEFSEWHAADIQTKGLRGRFQ
jgi:hypothetical protein